MCAAFFRILERMVKKLLFKFICFVVLLLLCQHLNAQDIIIKSNNDSIRSTILEINTENIRFRYYNMKYGPVLQIHKNEVKEIIYENGSKLTILYNPYEVSSDMMIKEKSRAIKVDILSPSLNHFVLGYEMKIRTAVNLEFKASLIATNLSTSLKYSEGYFIKGGVKFVKLTKSYMRGLKYVQPLKGNYFKPEFIFNRYKRDEDHTFVTYTNYALNLVFGRQDVINNFFVIDYFGGMGYSYQATDYESTASNNGTVGDFSYAYSHLFFGKRLPLILTGGVLIGFVY